MRSVYVYVPTGLNRGFDYAVPDGMQLHPGEVVEVPLGSRHVLGVVSDEAPEQPSGVTLKPVLRQFTDMPAFSSHMLAFVRWVADYTLAPIGAVVKMALPCPRAFTHSPKSDYTTPAIVAHMPPLVAAQSQASDAIVSVPEHVHKTIVLNGVTGSGKTEIYTDALLRILARSPQAQILVLLPEIALTHQWLTRFEARCGFTPLLWHSTLTPAQRARHYRAIALGRARVVVGARSALFLPYAQLKLIVVDEEHEASYKQEDGVCYHARDMAIKRAAIEKIPVVLASATPSLETQENIAQKKYTPFLLPSRFGQAQMPAVHCLDMRQEAMDSGQFISPSLREAMLAALTRGEQAMLFLNRRGYAPLVLCRSCGHRMECPRCSAWLVLHKAKTSGVQDRLCCHHCGYRAPAPPDCPSCHSEGTLVACGPGIDRVAEETRQMLPSARISVLSSDHTPGSDEWQAIIAGERDIIIGTQMVAKGHHFPHLTVVGVIDADLGLEYGGDLRASERCFQLLHQLAGRAGRESTPGHVFLQSYAPEHPVIQALCRYDAEGFYALEREARRLGGWPPFGHLASVLLDGPDEASVRAYAQQLARAFTPAPGVRLLGPAPALLSRLKGQYRFRLLLKTPKHLPPQPIILDWLGRVRAHKKVRMKIDVNPYNFM